MPAIDTIASFQTTVGSTLAAGVMAAGDSAQVRNHPQTAEARLLAAYYDSVTNSEVWRVRSPLLHDNVQGLRFFPEEDPTARLLPPFGLQKLYPQDELIFEFTTAAATGKALGALLIYYSQLPGAAARLYNPGDVQSLVKNLKPVTVSIASGANTAGAWFDSLLNEDEDLLHANTDYAVLGFLLDVGVAAVAIKGVDTGNLRIGAPGSTRGEVTAGYFVDLSMATGLPCIPVINSANAGATHVSIVSSAATAAILNVGVILAELSQNLG
jgi:hypothetical protein